MQLRERKCVARSVGRLVGLNMSAAEAKLRVEPEPAATRQRRLFIVSRAFSKFANFDSKVASWKDWAFENMAAVVTSSRDTLDWAAQKEKPILTVDDVALAALLRGWRSEANLARGLPSPTQPIRNEIHEHVLAHLRPRSWCGHCLRSWGENEPSAFSQ